jgi:hypothetical protein
VFENRLLRRIFGPKRDEATGGWRKLHNEDLHNLYTSPSQINENEMGKACSTNGREKECMLDIAGKTRMKETTGKTKT